MVHTLELLHKCVYLRYAEMLRITAASQYVKLFCPVSVLLKLSIGRQSVPSQLLNPDLRWQGLREALVRATVGDLGSKTVNQWSS